MDRRISEITMKMINYDKGDAARIQHFMKVHNFSKVIGEMEGLDPETQFILEAAAVLHDIGIHKSEEKYNSCDGKYQEIEGPAEAEELLNDIDGISKNEIERICYLIAHHHTYDNISGMDYQILVEADFLVNLFEEHAMFGKPEVVRDHIFKTETGKKILNNMFMEKYEINYR